MSKDTQAALAGFLLAVMFMMAGRAAHADTVALKCEPPTQNVDGSALTDLAGIRWLYGASPTALVVAKDTPTCETAIEGLSVGTWYFAAKAFTSAGAESNLSNIASKTIAPVVLTLKTIGGDVRNTGTFDPKAWAVRSNKPYGTIAADVPCDPSRAAVDGWYRVPSAAVKWTSARAVTPYPLAKCELRP